MITNPTESVEERIDEIKIKLRAISGQEEDSLEILFKKIDNIISSIKEGKELIEQLTQIKQQKSHLESKLHSQETNLNNLQKQLDELKNELSKKESERQDLASTKLTTEQTKSTDLESQITALAISTGLLTSKIEDLSKQLSEAEVREEKSRF